MHFGRDEYFDHLFSRGSGREIFVEMFGPLVGLEAEWQAQGASPDELSLDAFDFDSVEFCWVGDTGPRGDRTPQVEFDSPDYSIRVDALGRRMKLIKSTATLPMPMNHPVESMDDWRRVRHWMNDHPGRSQEDQIAQAMSRRAAGAIVAVAMPGGFDLPRQLMGEENACLAFLDEPEMIHDMLTAAGDTSCAVIDRIAEKGNIDYLHIHEDFAGKSGPLIGPDIIREFLQPYYRRVWNRVRDAGGLVFSIDSDGNVNPVIGALLDAGINQIYPNEPAAGMDIVHLRKKYGKRLLIKGGIDKHVLRQSKEAIRAELKYKTQACMRGGGVVFGLDHRIPNGTPLENYRYYVATAREFLNLPPAVPRNGSWHRMAF